jgi:hypothetical protein
MTTSNLIRWSGLTAIAAGVLNVLDAKWHPPWMTTLMAVVTVFALIGIYAVQAKASGRLGFAGYVVATAGYVVMPGVSNTIVGSLPSYIVGASLGAVGLVLLAVGSLSAHVFPRWVPGMWIAAVVIGLPSLAEPSLADLLGILGAAVGGAGLAGAGYILWNSGATLAAAPTRTAHG